MPAYDYVRFSNGVNPYYSAEKYTVNWQEVLASIDSTHRTDSGLHRNDQFETVFTFFNRFLTTGVSPCPLKT